MNVACNLDFHDRHYDPRTGRFISEDPILFKGKDFNLYRYVFNDPINKLDPDGKQAAPVIIGGAALCFIYFEWTWVEGKMKQIRKEQCSKKPEPEQQRSCSDTADQKGAFGNLGDIIGGASGN